MMLQEAVSIDASAAVVRQRVMDRLRLDGLDGVSAQGFEAGRTVLLRAGVEGLSKKVEVMSLPPYTRGETTVFAIRWTAAGRLGGLFPILDANLEIVPQPDGSTLLRVVGSYRPPLGRAGAVVDQSVGWRAARATMKGFLTQLSRVTAETVAASDVIPAIDGFRAAGAPGQLGEAPA